MRGMFQWWGAGCLALVLLLGNPAQAQEAEAGSDTVSLNFVNADIGAVIQAISKLSGRNFVVDPRVKGNINIVTTTPVPRAMSYSILSSALRLQGYAVVEVNGITQVVPEVDAKLHAGPVNKGRKEGDDNRVITQVFVLKHESAVQVVPVIRPLVAPNNLVTAYPGNNSVVVTDYAENVRRIGQIIESIDVPQDGVRVFPLSHASAVDVAATISRLMTESASAGAADGSQKISVVADSRSNSLLVRSDNLSKIAAVRQLVNSLDVPGALGNIHVVYLKNAEAAKVAQTLRAVLSGDTSALPSSGSAVLSGTSSSASSAQSSAVSAPSSAVTGSSSQGGMIQADPMTNSLIITAPEPLYNNLRRAIEQLDRRRAQVYVEALITEISAETAAEFGIQWQAGKLSNGNSSNLVGGTNFGSGGANILNVANGVTPSTGLNLILGDGTVSVLGKEILNLNMLARLLQSETHANILSTPNLITLDNEEAKMVIGQNLPFVTGQYTSTGTTSTVSNPFQTIERKDVGLTLKIKPQISESGTVRLQIYQEVSSVVGNTAGNQSGPITNKRSIESTVLVEDGSIIALGGLIEDSYNSGSDRVPMLGDLPVVGGLFRYDSRKRSKTNLIVFLRPVILRDASSAQGITDERYDYIIGMQRNADKPQRLMRNEAPFPELPAREAAAPAQPYYLPEGEATPVSSMVLRQSEQLSK